ncbi:MAG: TolC family protein, partial [Bacteroidota bacterium]
MTKRQRLALRHWSMVLWFVALPASAQPALEALVAEGLAANPTLARFSAASEAASASTRAARGAFGPTVGIEARGTVAEGGRTIDLPLGELLNPVYETLDELRARDGLPPAFPRLEDESIALARTEADVRLVAEQPVFVPALGASLRAARAQEAAAVATREAYAAELRGAIRAAYWRYRAAARGVEVQEAAARRVAEFRRRAERERAAGAGLRVAVVRASAEALAVETDLREAKRGQTLALASLNRLVGRPLDAPVPEAVEAPLPDTLPAGPLRLVTEADPASVVTAEDLEAAAVAARAELAALGAAVEARDAAVSAARAEFLPTLGVRVDAGATGGRDALDEPFVLASAVVRWRPFGASGDGARVARARAERAAAEADRAAAEADIRLQVRDAHERLAVAYADLRSAGERVALGDEGFRLTTRLVALGDANQADFIDAQTALTQAEQARSVARFEVLARLAELEAATGLRLR